MDTEFTRINAKGSRADAQAELAPGSICGQLPEGFDPKVYATHPFHIRRWIHDGDTIDLGGQALQVIAVPGHTPDAICLLDHANGLLFRGDTTPAKSGYTSRRPIWMPTFILSNGLPRWCRKSICCSLRITFLYRSHRSSRSC